MNVVEAAETGDEDGRLMQQRVEFLSAIGAVLEHLLHPLITVGHQEKGSHE